MARDEIEMLNLLCFPIIPDHIKTYRVPIKTVWSFSSINLAWELRSLMIV
jgi:hypothetical protein